MNYQIKNSKKCLKKKHLSRTKDDMIISKILILHKET